MLRILYLLSLFAVWVLGCAAPEVREERRASRETPTVRWGLIFLGANEDGPKSLAGRGEAALNAHFARDFVEANSSIESVESAVLRAELGRLTPDMRAECVLDSMCLAELLRDVDIHHVIIAELFPAEGEDVDPTLIMTHHDLKRVYLVNILELTIPPRKLERLLRPALFKLIR